MSQGLGVSFLLKKRRNTDVNNMNFIGDNAPIGINPSTGFPISREIDHPDFVPQTFSTVDYKAIAVNDNYGFFTTWVCPPGVRKIQQNILELTLEQKQNTFQQPTFMIAFLGFRPTLYDAASDTYIPLIDHFQLDRYRNNVCRNINRDLDGLGPNDVWQQLSSAGAVPLQIDLVAGGIYSRNPMRDFAYILPISFASTTTVGNKVYTNHEIKIDIVQNLPDILNFPDGVNVEFKLQTFLISSELPPSISASPDPILRLMDSDNFVNFSANAVFI